MRSIHIIYRARKDNASADALSRNPRFPAPAIDMEEMDVHVASVTTSNPSELNSSILLEAEPGISVPGDFSAEQRKDPAIAEFVAFMEREELPADEKRARKIGAQSSFLSLVDGICTMSTPSKAVARGQLCQSNCGRKSWRRTTASRWEAISLGIVCSTNWSVIGRGTACTGTHRSMLEIVLSVPS